MSIGNIHVRYEMAKVRAGTHFLREETGRYINLQRQFRTCYWCCNDDIQTVEHYIINCSVFTTTRKKFQEKLISLGGEGSNMNIFNAGMGLGNGK